jgi:phosphate transport system substrate-binding protein
MKKLSTIAVIMLALLLAGLAQATDQVDPRTPSYKKTSGVSGSINSIGSDTMNNLMAYWCEDFSKLYPNVKCQVEGKGSSTAPPALIQATAQLGPMSRAMKSSEIDEFEKKFGYKPTQIKTALDGIGIFVNKDNPIKGLTMDQVDAIFSKTLKCGGKEEIKTWGQLGLTGETASRSISLYGRNAASGTYGFFKEHALCKGDYKNEVKEQPGSSSVVQGVAEDRNAAGYSGIGFVTSGVRAVPLAPKGSQDFKEPTLENIIKDAYPLGRFLYVYVNKAPNKPLDPLVREFVTFILSKEGQRVVIKDGFYPVPAGISSEQMKAVK